MCAYRFSSFAQAKIGFDGVVAMLTDLGRLADSYRVLDHENMALIQRTRPFRRTVARGWKRFETRARLALRRTCLPTNQRNGVTGGERLAAADKNGPWQAARGAGAVPWDSAKEQFSISTRGCWRIPTSLFTLKSTRLRRATNLSAWRHCERRTLD